MANIVNKIKRNIFNKHIKISLISTPSAGKTTAITSIINYFLYRLKDDFNNKAHQNELKEYLSNIDNIRLLSNKAINSETNDFEYSKYINNIVSEQKWPEKTSSISSCIINLKMKYKGLINLKRNDLLIEFIDYPSYLLNDLPMLHMSFLEWCKHIFNNHQTHKQWKDILNNSNITQKIKSEISYVQNKETFSLNNILPDPISKLLLTDKLPFNDKNIISNISDQYYYLLQKQYEDDHITFNIQPSSMLDKNNHKYKFFPIFSNDFDNLIKIYNEKRYHMRGTYLYYLEQEYNKFVNESLEVFYKQYVYNINLNIFLFDPITTLSKGNIGIQYIENLIEKLQYENNEIFKEKDVNYILVNKSDNFSTSNYKELSKFIKIILDKSLIEKGSVSADSFKIYNFAGIRTTNEEEVNSVISPLGYINGKKYIINHKINISSINNLEPFKTPQIDIPNNINKNNLPILDNEMRRLIKYIIVNAIKL